MSEEEKQDIITIFGEIIDSNTNRPKDRIDASKIINQLWLGSFQKAAMCEEGKTN
jgi:hypothetical protein